MEIRRLQWRCRRGLLELDVLLNRFLDNQYSHLNKEQQQNFSDLLEQSDQNLIDWLLQGQQPDAQFSELVARIKTISPP